MSSDMEIGSKENLTVYKLLSWAKKTSFSLCLPQYKKQSHNWQNISCYHKQLKNPNHLHSCSPANSYWCTPEKTLSKHRLISFVPRKYWKNWWYELKHPQQMDDIPCYLRSSAVFQLSQSLAKALTCNTEDRIRPGSRQESRQIHQEAEKREI